MEKKRISFLFGAGVEGNGNFDLPTGYDYLKNSLFGNENRPEIIKVLRDFFSDEYFDKGYSYRGDTYSNARAILKNLIKSKILKENDFLLKNKDDISIILMDADFKELSEDARVDDIIKNNGIKHTTSKNEKSKKIEKEFKNVLNSNMPYEDLEEPLLKSLFIVDDNGKPYIDMNIGIGGMFDGYFHTIISPAKYGTITFSKVFNYYWMCYFAIVESIAKFLYEKVPEIQQYYDGDKLDYYKVLCEIGEFTKLLYEKISNSEFNTGLDYYSLIKNTFANNDGYELKAIATTNYYRFCETVQDEVIYLNGALKWFEFPELLEVRDVRLAEVGNDNIFFPFIFGQSLVKPIVHPIQIHEFERFSNDLSNTDVLVVFGFNINEDDSHINAFIHNYVKEGKRIIIVGQMSGEEGKEDVSKKLRCTKDDIEYCCVKYGNNAEVVKCIFDTIKGA